MFKFQDIKKLLSNDELKTALNIVMKITEELDYKEYYSEVIMLTSSYNGNENSYKNDAIDHKEYTRKRGNITSRINNFLDKMKENLNDDFYQEILFEESKYHSYDDFKNRYLNKFEVPKPSISRPFFDKKDNISEKNTQETILFLSANPTETGRIQVNKEHRLVQERMNRNEYYEFLMPQLDLTAENLMIAMNQKPHIVHFAGHGERNAIIVTNNEDNTKLEIPANALKRLFKKHKNNLKLVFLNSCYSAKQAKGLSELGFYVIGMNNAAKDSGSITFASGLYIGLSEGQNIEEAFDDAMFLIETKHPNFADLPEIWKDGEKLEL